MIDVEQSALRPFQEDGLAALQRFVHDSAGVDGDRQEARGKAVEQGHVLGGVGPLGRAEQLEELVRRPDAGADELFGAVEVAQVAHPNAAPAIFVLVGWPDAAPGGADLVPLLARAVEQLVIGERQVRAIRDVELVIGTNPA